ncbi:lipopolysaccharide biosynthesis protein [Shewanella sp. 10N.286.45.A1]|uniref:lipopolysaccharide biosynthesis protein n=1 Tax=Shewanella sp. 10N.286.45.A1 TaxID=3229694 RepID=UPI003554737E
MSLINKTATGIGWSLLDKIVSQVVTFLLFIYLSKNLSPSAFGLVAMLAVFLAVAQSVIDSGFSQALIQKSNKVTVEDLSTVFYVNLLLSCLIYAVLYVSAPMIAHFFNQPDLILLSRVLFSIVIVNAIAIVPRTKFIIEIDFKTQSIINTISTVFSSVVTVYMVINEFGYWSLVGMSLSKALCSSILLIILSRWIPKAIFSYSSLKSLFSFGSNLLIAGLISTFVQNLYTILIGRYFNSSQVGFFHQGYTYTNVISTTMTSVIQGVTYPIMTSIQEDNKRLTRIYIRLMGVVSMLSFPIFVGFAAVAEEFVLLFLGDNWKPMIPVLVILSFARLITPISSLNLNILNAKGRSDLFLKVDVIKIPMIIGFLFLAIPYGIVGVAFAQLSAVIISFFINAYYPGKLFGFGAKEQLRQIIPIAFAAMTMYFFVSLIEIDNTLLQLTLKVILGVVVYVSLCLMLKINAFIDVFTLVKSRFNKVSL